jgi:hypothetical protein
VDTGLGHTVISIIRWAHSICSEVRIGDFFIVCSAIRCRSSRIRRDVGVLTTLMAQTVVTLDRTEIQLHTVR